MLLSRAPNGTLITPAQARALHENRNLIISTVRSIEERLDVVRRITADVKRYMHPSVWDTQGRQEIRERLARAAPRERPLVSDDTAREYAARQALKPNLTYYDWHEDSEPEEKGRTQASALAEFNLAVRAGCFPRSRVRGRWFCFKCGKLISDLYYGREKSKGDMCQACASGTFNRWRSRSPEEGIADGTSKS